MELPTDLRLEDRIHGSLLAAAVGDALGAPLLAELMAVDVGAVNQHGKPRDGRGIVASGTGDAGRSVDQPR